jgi:hypothetical protein
VRFNTEVASHRLGVALQALAGSVSMSDIDIEEWKRNLRDATATGQRAAGLSDWSMTVRCGRRHPRRRPWWSWLGSHRIGYRRCACGRRWAWDAGQWVAYGDPEPGVPPDEPAGASSAWDESQRDAACYCPAGPLDCAGCDE